ncbi:MAG TPA: 2-amino-4-hydroxy-6-hydroxymethyldihydropteridine diphosphokinase [Acidimicrobiia bacterium]|nr:2-amino-4-hydroxy-6-hydroxymethyldihydropteridine diphosphokinase [Acidimicrobiia bacterium]
MRRAFLGLGANLGDRAMALQRAVDSIAAAGVRVVAVSPVYETDPVGGPEQPDYLNAVVEVDTDRPARELLRLGQQLEEDARRTRRQRWGPRTLDVDVLLVGDEVVDEPDLTVPHPRMWDRQFVLVPLADLAPELTAGHQLAGRRDGVRATEVTLALPQQ